MIAGMRRSYRVPVPREKWERTYFAQMIVAVSYIARDCPDSRWMIFHLPLIT
jgi:hypothetical protein